MSLPQTPSFRLDGRRAIVTGAGRGIGLALAAALAQAGAAVTLLARSAPEIVDAAARIRAEGGAAEAETVDVLDLAAVAGFFSARPAFHVLVNNAGTNHPKSILEVTEHDYDAVLDLNLKSAYFVAQSAARRMIEVELVIGQRLARPVGEYIAPEAHHGARKLRAGGLQMALHAHLHLPLGSQT